MGEPAIDWRCSFAPPVVPVEALPEADFAWADVISIHAYKLRPANDLPEPLPAWISDSPERLTFLRLAPLTDDKIRGMVRSRDTFARRVRETAEGMASEFDRDDKPRPRSISFEQSQRLLLHLLPLADRCQRIERPFLDSVRVRLADLRATKRTRRRAEIMALYRAMLSHGLPLSEADLLGDDQHLTTRDRRIRREVTALLRDEGRPRTVSAGSTNPHAPNASWWDPPATPAPVKHWRVQAAPLFSLATKNETIPNTWNETPTSGAGLPMRGFELASQI